MNGQTKGERKVGFIDSIVNSKPMDTLYRATEKYGVGLANFFNGAGESVRKDFCDGEELIRTGSPKKAREMIGTGEDRRTEFRKDPTRVDKHGGVRDYVQLSPEARQSLAA